VGGGGGYVAGKTQEVRWLGQGGTYQSSANYRTATILPANKNKWQMLDQEVYGFGTVCLLNPEYMEGLGKVPPGTFLANR
jgi:hypothetical protein